jgi:hypothetical protein
MKKIKKNSVKKKPLAKKKVKKIINKKQKKNLKIKKNINKKKNKKKQKVNTKKEVTLISRLVTLQNSLKPEFNFKINFSLEKYIQAFFDGIANRISEYKTLKAGEKRRRQLEEIEKKEQKRKFNQNLTKI